MPRQSNTLHLIEISSKDGATLVFIPGLSGTTRYWQNRLKILEKDNRILLVDPLGFGDSPKPWTRYTVDSHVDALNKTLVNEKQVTLIGHSMGALLSIAYAAKFPGQVQSLVLISLPFFGGAEEARRFFSNQSFPLGWFFSNMVLAAMICMVTRRIFGKLIPFFRPDLPQEIAVDIVKHSWRSFTSSFWEVICKYDAKKDVARLGSLPVLCIHGEQDKTAPLAGVLALTKEKPNFKLYILPGVDHQPWLRNSQLCQDLVATALVPDHSGSYTISSLNIQKSKVPLVG